MRHAEKRAADRPRRLDPRLPLRSADGSRRGPDLSAADAPGREFIALGRMIGYIQRELTRLGINEAKPEVHQKLGDAFAMALRGVGQ